MKVNNTILTLVLLLVFGQFVYGQFTLSGSTITHSGSITKTGNQTTVLEDIEDIGLMQKFDESLYHLGNGERVLIGGTVVDETGDFNLYLQNNSSFVISGSGSLRVGKRQVVNNLPQYSGGGVITVRPTTQNGITNGRHYLHYNNSNDNGTAATGENRFYDCALTFYTLTSNSRQDIYFTEISGSKIKGVQQGADHSGKYVVLRIQQGGRFDDNVVSDIKQFEFHATAANPLVSFARNKFTNLVEGFISFSTGTLVELENPNFLGTWDRLGWFNNGGVYYIDPYIDNIEATEAQLVAKTLIAQGGGSETVRGVHIGKSHREHLIDDNENDVNALVWFKDTHGTTFTPTVTSGEYSQAVKLKRNTNTTGAWASGVWKNYYPIKKAIASYNHEYYGEEFTTYDDFEGVGVDVTANRIIRTDASITEFTKATVDAYTEINNLDQLYDRAKSWKVSSANLEHPTIDSLLIIGDGITLNLGNHDLIIDKNATSAFSVNKTNRTITIKADTLVIGDKFTSISTTGSVTTQNSAIIEFGFEDNTGINKFVHLDWNQNTTQDVSVKNLSTNTSIVNSVSSTEIYKGHFLMPDPAPSSGIQVEIASTSGFLLFQEIFPEDDLNFIRTDITLNASEERQVEMLFLTKKLLQKSESINEVISGTTPNITDNTTVTNSNAAATNENQVAILQLLERILNKVSANREAFE